MGVRSIAERRMISKKIVESAKFIKMPATSQNLYFHLVLNADDDGVVESFPVLNLIRANEDDLRVLVSKGFVQVLNEDLVSFIVDWREQNTLRPDRKIDSLYKELLLRVNPDVDLLEMRERSDTKSTRKSGRSMDGPWTAQYKVIEGNIREENTREGKETEIAAQLGTEILTKDTYLTLVKEYSEEIVKRVITRILEHPYTGCLNEKTIREWCREQELARKRKKAKANNMDSDSERQYDFDALEKILFKQP